VQETRRRPGTGAAEPPTIPSLDSARLRTLLPTLGTAGLGDADAADVPLRGRVLRLRLGFNPNSSSVGTTVVVFLWGLIASGAVLSFTAAVLAHRFRRKGRSGDVAEAAGATS
jgi:hypothetical protein